MTNITYVRALGFSLYPIISIKRFSQNSFLYSFKWKEVAHQIWRLTSVCVADHNLKDRKLIKVTRLGAAIFSGRG